MKKVLILTYYWPPSGGAGVQRWLKLSKYIARQNVEVHVLTVDPNKASYATVDERLIKEVSKEIIVHTTNTFEPINYYEKVVGKSNVPKSGYSNVSKQGFKIKIISAIRSNLFIPDPRKGWRKYALRKAKKLIEQHGIRHVVTTSPPHSVQLIGLKLKKKYGSKIKWTSDLRDPWTDIYYYDLLNHSFISKRIDAKYERRVIEQCDVLLTLGETFKKIFLSKTGKNIEDKVALFSNGYDPDDFKNVKLAPQDSVYTITYTGTMANSYEPEIFFDAVAKLIESHPDKQIEFKMVGAVSEKIKSELFDLLKDKVSFTPHVSHTEAINLMCNADLLFLATPGDPGPVPGKIFEYLAAKKPIIGVGMGDTATILAKTKAGKSFSRNEAEPLYKFLLKCFNDHQNNVIFAPEEEVVKNYNSDFQARQMLATFLD